MVTSKTDYTNDDFEIVSFGDIVEGDIIEGTQGLVRVSNPHDKHIPERMFEIAFNNGTNIKASGNHLWYVETIFDISLHKQRRREGKKFLKKLNSEQIKTLIDVANSPDEVETSLIDMIVLTNAKNDKNGTNIIVRIAESIGHIAENTTTYSDYLTGEDTEVEKETIRTYDARLFSQQVLSLKGDRKYRKKWPLIIGRVIPTTELVPLSELLEIPTIREKNT